MTDQIIRLQELMEVQRIDAMLVSSYENGRYLSGYTGGEATLLITPDNRVLYTDSRYTEQAEKEAAEFTVMLVNGLSDLFERIGDMAAQQKIKRIGIEADKVTVSWFQKASGALHDITLVPLTNELDRLRWHKDETEIQAIQRSQDVTDAAYADIVKRLRTGISEIEIRSEIDYFMAKHGGAPSFDTIVASGPNGSMPHAQPTMRKLQPGDFVTMDFGCKLGGYCSDMTRTVAIGEPSDEMRKVYGIVLEAQRRALDKIMPDVVCNDVDRAARGFIADNGYGDFFGHGLGHGFGLMIHEEPRFSPLCDEVVKPGICISVEPGIYLPGRFGVRIEDTICITSDGFINFTHAPKELAIL